MLVSVVMGIYNYNSEHLKACILSVLNQTYENFEFIIVLDGDRSALPIISSFSDDRIIVLENEVNMGLSYSLNKCISNSSGDIIVRIDADDISSPTRISTQVKYLEIYDIVATACIEIDTEGRKIKKSKIIPFYNFFLRTLLYRTNRFNPVVHSSVAGWKYVFEKYQYDVNIKFAQDYFLWKTMFPRFIIYFIPEYLTYYRNSHYSEEKFLYQKYVSNSIRNKRKI
jgi:glycosyltransferase involved in cell wall biosynthesis